MVNPFDTVHKFERVVAEYANAPYSIATDCCSHAIFLSAIYYKKKHGTCTVEMPKNTYVSAPMQMIHAGFDVDFVDKNIGFPVIVKKISVHSCFQYFFFDQ